MSGPAAVVGPDAVWRLVPGTTGLYASPDGRWTAHTEYAVWILTDRASAVITADRITYPTRGFYTLAEMRAYVARQYPDSMEDPRP